MQPWFRIAVPAEFKNTRLWSQIRECYICEESYFYEMIRSIDDDATVRLWMDQRRRLIVAGEGSYVRGIACLESNGIINIYVRPRLRRQGLGTMLYRRLELLSREPGWQSLQPGCRHDAQSTFFYRAIESNVP